MSCPGNATSGGKEWSSNAEPDVAPDTAPKVGPGRAALSLAKERWMTIERQVIVCTGVVATLSGDEDADDSLVNRLGDALLAAAQSVAAGVPGGQVDGTITIHYLGDGSVNAERCSCCG